MASKHIHNAALVALAKLDPTHPGFAASPEVAAMLRSEPLSLYLRTWVLPPIRSIEDGRVHHDTQRKQFARDAAQIRTAMVTAQRPLVEKQG